MKNAFITRLVTCKQVSETKYPEFKFDTLPSHEDLGFTIYLEAKGDDVVELRPRVSISDGMEDVLIFDHLHLTRRNGTAYAAFEVRREHGIGRNGHRAWWFPKGTYCIRAEVGEARQEIFFRVI